MASRFDVSESIFWEDDLPHLYWDLIEAYIESLPSEEQRATHDDIVRQWLDLLAESLGPQYEQFVTRRFTVLAPPTMPTPPMLARLAEACRDTLEHLLPDVARFPDYNYPIVVLADEDTYYQYLSAYYPEGNHGASAGICIREGLPHIAMRAYERIFIDRTLAHELTHTSLTHLEMPQWIEEGLAQMFEHELAARDGFEINSKAASKHRGYWGRHGLDEFWRGEGFNRPGRVQELSYQLAEVLVRILLEDHKPRWFGLVRGKQAELMAFLQNARVEDCGESAATEHLGTSLGELASKFLGPGHWQVTL